jgi:hypothetical protein
MDTLCRCNPWIASLILSAAVLAGGVAAAMPF